MVFNGGSIVIHPPLLSARNSSYFNKYLVHENLTSDLSTSPGFQIVLSICLAFCFISDKSCADRFSTFLAMQLRLYNVQTFVLIVLLHMDCSF